MTVSRETHSAAPVYRIGHRRHTLNPAWVRQNLPDGYTTFHDAAGNCMAVVRTSLLIG